MKRLLQTCLVLAAAAVPARALVGDWISFTRLSEIRDLRSFGGALWAATSGGIRHIPLDGRQETVYRNPEGLRDISIQVLVPTPEGDLWAVSESGFIYRLLPDRTRWELYGASYSSSGWKMRTRAALYRAPYLILGSEKGLSFYHLGKRTAEANITRMGPEKSIIVNAVHMVGDTLFAGTSKGIFRATLHVDRLTTDTKVNIFNPDIWTRIAGTEARLYHRPGEPPPGGSSEGDAIPEIPPEDTLLQKASQDSAHGFLYYTPDGIASEFAGSATSGGSRVAKFGTLLLDGGEHPNPRRMEALEKARGRWFVGSKQGLFEYRPAREEYLPVRNPNDLPEWEVTMIRATRHGVYAFGMPQAFKLSGESWWGLPNFERFSAYVDANRRGSHPFHVIGNDSLVLGTWGGGLYTYMGEKERKGYRSGDGTNCLTSAVESDPIFSVVIAQTPYRGKQGVFLATAYAGKPYGLAYLDLASGALTCFDVDSRDLELLSMEIIGEDLLVAVTHGGIATYRIRERDGEVALEAPNLTAYLRSPETTMSGLSDRLGNFWVTTGSGKLFYIPELGRGRLDSLSFRTLENFPGNECKSIDRDSRGHIWVGCFSGGVVEITPGRDSLAHTFTRYGTNHGLLSETVYHLSVDSASGHVWMVTDRGITRYESASKPSPKSLSAARAYPNPFLAKHSQVIFDRLEEGSELQILTQGGSVLYRARLQPSDGDQLRWDGRNHAGRRVSEGVYFYVIRSSGDLKRGKLIVGR